MSINVLYWRGSGEVRTDILSAFRTTGLALEVFSTFDEVLDRIRFDPPHALIVDASAGETEASQRVVELSGVQQFRSVPIIFVSYHAAIRSTVLRREYEHFTPVDVPFSSERLLRALGVGESAAKKAPKHVSSPDPAKLAPAYGGEFFFHAGRVSQFSDELLIPPHPRREVVIRALDRLAEQDPWMALHGRRSAFVSSALLNTMGGSPERDARARIVSLLFDWGLQQETNFVRTADLLFVENQDLMPVVARGLLETSRFLSEQLEDPASAALAGHVSDTLAMLPKATDPETQADVECVIVAELVDRACWGDGKWNPHGAHRAVRQISNGFPIPLDEAMITACLRLITDASSGAHAADDSTRPPPTPEAQKAESDAVALFGHGVLNGLAVPDLKSGMRLTRPIYTRDGHLVLHANVELSDSLIRRLWRLSAIRPLRSPVYVQTR